MHPAPEFYITASGPVSTAFRQRGITRFSEAAAYVKNIPYGRNLNKYDVSTVFTDNCGTCGTKHALLKLLATEHGYDDLRLMIGVFRMNALNSPPVKNTLATYGLSYLPEAHNYFRFHRHIFDYTFPRSKPFDLESELLKEIEIAPEEITDFKVQFHKQFLEHWLQQNTDITYTPDELWRIREECIRDLSKR